MRRFLLIMAALVMPFVALAEEPEEINPDFTLEAEREILLPMPGATYKDNFNLNLNRGLEFKHEFRIKNKPFAFSIYGPVDKNGPGAVMKIKGNYAGYPVKFKGYGNIEKQGFLFTVDF